jgi:hypothetical protein
MYVIIYAIVFIIYVYLYICIWICTSDTVPPSVADIFLQDQVGTSVSSGHTYPLTPNPYLLSITL